MKVGQTIPSQTGLEHLPQGLTVCNVYDLLLVVGLAALLPGLTLLPVPLVRVPLGLAAVLFMPGYALVSVLFPRQAELDGVARAALGFGLSLATLPIMALALNALPWGISALPIAIALSIWSLLLSAVSLWRRRRAARLGTCFALPVVHPLRRWHGLRSRVKLFYSIGALVTAVLLAGTAFSVLAPDPRARLTEFYALGPDGLAENYPRAPMPGQEMQVQLGLSNREGSTARYWVEVRKDGELLAGTEPVELENGATWEGPVRYKLKEAGDNQRIDILLFHQDDPNPYRQLRLWVNVRSVTYTDPAWLRKANVNFDRQMHDWRALRDANNEDTFDWEAFRLFQRMIRAPDPGPMPTKAFATQEAQP